MTRTPQTPPFSRPYVFFTTLDYYIDSTAARYLDEWVPKKRGENSSCLSQFTVPYKHVMYISPLAESLNTTHTPYLERIFNFIYQTFFYYTHAFPVWETALEILLLFDEKSKLYNVNRGEISPSCHHIFSQLYHSLSLSILFTVPLFTFYLHFWHIFYTNCFPFFILHCCTSLLRYSSLISFIAPSTTTSHSHSAFARKIPTSLVRQTSPENNKPTTFSI